VQFALPNRHDAEALSMKSVYFIGIPRLICMEFLGPKNTIPLWNGRAWTVTVMMPKTSIHEHCPPFGFVCEIRGAGQRLHISPVTQSEATQYPCSASLCGSSPLPHAPHQFRTNRVRRTCRFLHSAAIKVRSSESAASIARTWLRCARTRSLKPGTNRKELFSIRDRKPAVARGDNRAGL
jgi:hypothetical protein